MNAPGPGYSGNEFMGTCLSDHDFAAFVEASATPGQLSNWNEHLDTCDSCALRLARRHVSPSRSRGNEIGTHRGQDDGSDQDAVASPTFLREAEVFTRAGRYPPKRYEEYHETLEEARRALSPDLLFEKARD